VAWSSANDGTSWAPFTTCSGGTGANNGSYDRASDVWLSAGPDGVVYQSALVFDELTAQSGITVSRSTYGGESWSAPVFVDKANRMSFSHGDDKESVTADPNKPGWVYAVWDRYSNQKPIFTDGHGQNANKGPAYFSRSTDGGTTWSPPEAIYARDNGTIGNQIVVLPNGALADFFTNFVATNVKGGIAFTLQLDEIRSSDGGLIWSPKPLVVSTMTPNGAVDPNTGHYIRGGDSLFDVAVDRTTGALDVVWQDARFNSVDQVAFSSSTDGGTTWSAPVRVDGTPDNSNAVDEQAFTPAVAIAADGDIAVT
jgi:hypothetical protein